jgi:Co/Zn/Cd efflux system component
MLVDALSYIANLFAECTPNPRTKKKMELMMSMVSLVLLIYFTTDFLLEAVDNINCTPITCECDADNANCHWSDNSDNADGACSTETEGDEKEEDEVNAYIVLGFALGGLLFEFISLWAYKHYSTEAPKEASAHPGHPHHHHLEDHPLQHRHKSTEGPNDHEGTNVNMLSALMHVFSDLLRSTTTFVESIVLFQYPDVNSAVVDGWAALIVCSLIALGAIWSLGLWVGEVCAYFREGGRGEEEEEEEKDNLTRKLIDNV